MKERSLCKLACAMMVLFGILALAIGCSGQLPSVLSPSKNEELVVLTNSLTDESALPHKSGSGVGFALWSGLYETLARRDRNTVEPIPGLAERWEVAPDQKKYTFYLRKGVQFHDGWGELTAEDVKYAFDLTMRKDSISPRAGQWRNLIANIVIENPYQIAFALKQPDWRFTDDLTNYLIQLPIVSKKYVESVGEDAANERPIGTGPYKFRDRLAGDFIKFEALANHWRKVPEFKYLTVRSVPEESTRVAMLKTGEADIVPVTAERAPDIEKAGFRTVLGRGARLYHVVLGSAALPNKPEFNPALPWWADPADAKAWDRALKVRQALNLAINRQEINDKLFLGKGDVAAVPFIWSNQPGYDSSWKPYPYDPGKAKQLLAEAGYPNGFEVAMILLKYGGRPEAPQLGEAVAMYWENIGLKVKRQPMDFDTLRPLMEGRKLKEAWVYSPNFSAEPMILFIRAQVRVDRPFMTGVEYQPVQDIMLRGEKEGDPAKRAEMIKEIGQIYYDNYFTVPLIAKNNVWGLSKRVGEWPTIIGNGFDLQEAEYITLKR